MPLAGGLPTPAQPVPIRPPQCRGPHCSQMTPEMRKVLLLLAILAVATGPALALRCHVCTSSSNCKKPQVCPAGSRSCRTMHTVEPLRGNLVTKDCVESCTPSYTLQGQVSSGTGSIQCCQEDLCNEKLHNAAPTGTTFAHSLGLVLGLLALVLAPSL
ncbi:lymphocyte antigen 6D [Macaca mulatta]|uniref:Lymphocyte antigen 6 family member D n=1 Tax=Macaca mulatta TaxID=9544 RepID=A0A5F7ZL90_MACMU|nr:lymphocyte antigen 6D [Macaca mulatta]XP_005564250.1 PREDICTED: lymphocyte antigen 6D [Macaca fascicularis]